MTCPIFMHIHQRTTAASAGARVPVRARIDWLAPVKDAGHFRRPLAAATPVTVRAISTKRRYAQPAPAGSIARWVAARSNNLIATRSGSSSGP